MHNLFELEDKVVLIAGAAGGFGSVIAQELAARGARLSLFDIDEEKLGELSSALSQDRAEACAFDARNESVSRQAIETAHKKWGRIDGLINCIGLFEIQPGDQMPQETFERVMHSNVEIAFHLSRAAAEFMKQQKSGRIIHFASVSDKISNPGYAAYAASKAALAQLTRVLAVELAQHSITVNAVSPAMTDTALTHKFLEEGENRSYAVSRIPMGRLGEPQDVLGAVILLLSDGGSFITGQSIYVDGGRSIS